MFPSNLDQDTQTWWSHAVTTNSTQPKDTATRLSPSALLPEVILLVATPHLVPHQLLIQAERTFLEVILLVLLLPAAMELQI
jgi:hypothetical protein